MKSHSVQVKVAIVKKKKVSGGGGRPPLHGGMRPALQVPPPAPSTGEWGIGIDVASQDQVDWVEVCGPGTRVCIEIRIGMASKVVLVWVYLWPTKRKVYRNKNRNCKQGCVGMGVPLTQEQECL